MQHVKMLSQLIFIYSSPGIKRILCSICIILLIAIQVCFAQLSPGDIAFTGYNSRTNDQFSFIVTKNINGGEIIYFTDRGYCNEKSTPGWNNTYEGIIKYTVPSGGLFVGDMIVIGDSDGWQIIMGTGNIVTTIAKFDLALAGDQIFAFQTVDLTDYTPTFIAGIQMNNSDEASDTLWDNIDETYILYEKTDLPNTLTNGLNAVRILDTGERENAKYKNFITQGLKSEILNSVNNRSNWLMCDNIPYTLGYPSTTSTIISGSWNSTNTWDATNGIPGKTTDVTINHNITVTANCAASDVLVSSGKSLTINSGKTLTIESDTLGSGSLIVDGSVNGSVAYNRYMTGNKWHLVSSPVSGQAINSFLADTTNRIPQKNGSDYGVMDYNTSDNGWNSYFKDTITSTFSSGKGYSLRRSSDGRVKFTGTVLTTDVNPPVSDAGERWNLLGNPYPSAINATTAADATNNFITANITKFDSSYAALYLWDEQANYTQGRSDYIVLNNTSSQKYIQAAQGFFIKVKTGVSSASFTQAMCTSQPTTPFKSGEVAWPSVIITARSGEKATKTTILFHEGMTKGLDVGYDAGVFKANSDFVMYSKLIEDNGVDFMIQCLPENFEEKFLIPIGLDASDLPEVHFSVESNNLPVGTEIGMEDRLMQSFTLFEGSVKTYQTKLTESETRRFILHIGNNLGTGVTKAKYNISVFPDSKMGKINIIGNFSRQTIVSVFDITGKRLTQETVNGSNPVVDFRNRMAGIYIIRIESERMVVSRKIKW